MTKRECRKILTQLHEAIERVKLLVAPRAEVKKQALDKLQFVQESLLVNLRAETLELTEDQVLGQLRRMNPPGYLNIEEIIGWRPSDQNILVFITGYNICKRDLTKWLGERQQEAILEEQTKESKRPIEIQSPTEL